MVHFTFAFVANSFCLVAGASLIDSECDRRRVQPAQLPHTPSTGRKVDSRFRRRSIPGCRLWLRASLYPTLPGALTRNLLPKFPPVPGIFRPSSMPFSPYEISVCEDNCSKLCELMRRESSLALSLPSPSNTICSAAIFILRFAARLRIVVLILRHVSGRGLYILFSS